MKLTNEEFKRFKELNQKLKKKAITESEKAELADLAAKRNVKGSNDLEWWDSYPALTDGVSNIPFNYIGGTNVRLHAGGIASLFMVSGVARLGYKLAIGKSLSSSDGFNAQMRQLWLDMHRKYRGMGGYQRSDLGIAILAIESLFATLAKFERIYGVCNTFKIYNRDIPYTLYEALGIAVGTPDVLADLRYGLNARISRMQQLCLPKGIKAIESELVNCSNLFKDSANPRASIFFFDQDSYGEYSPTLLSTGGSCMFVNYEASQTALTPAGNKAFSVSDMFNILDDQLDRLLNDDDIAKMCSDLIAAYGPENVLTVQFIPEDLVIEPVHDYERLLQFHNATPNGMVTSKYDIGLVPVATANSLLTNNIETVVYQNNDVIVCELTHISQNSAGYVADGNYAVVVSTAQDIYGKADDVVFDTWVDKPSKMEIMCGTRFTTLSGRTVTVSGNKYQDILSFGTCVPTTLTLYTRDNNTFTTLVAKGNTWAAVDWPIDNIMQVMTFDWHPIFYITTSYSENRFFGDIDNPAVITQDALSKIHDVAVYSAFKIPSVSYIN